MRHPLSLPRPLVRLFAVGVLTAAGLPAAMGVGITMDCDHDEPTVLSAQAQQGRARAERTADTLLVQWEKGKQRFEDRIPVVEKNFDEEHYFYCGYNPLARLHLVRKDTVDLFTGLLINDHTGQIIPAGYTVIFSPDLSRFLAIRQPEDTEGEVWVISNFDGTPLWEGRAGMTAEGDDSEDADLIAELDNPYWLPSGELQATHTCLGTDDIKSTRVTLKRVRIPGKPKGATYQWLPKVSCPTLP